MKSQEQLWRNLLTLPPFYYLLGIDAPPPRRYSVEELKRLAAELERLESQPRSWANIDENCRIVTIRNILTRNEL